MQSVQAETWDPRPPSKYASPLPHAPYSASRLAHVTTAAPAKRITFYKSGDSQFGGVRMAVHKRSFKCFDALLDDLSQKIPLPFGVRTVTTPRGTHTIKHLEQLQDGGCYLCSDRPQAKPVNMELASKRPNIWYHHNPRPHRPETWSATPTGHLPYRQRRILLVKNSEPGMRRSVVLSRRSARSLKAFLDEVSEVMQFHVRKLYTAEGRRIDSVQSLLTCPGVLVCVGREAFSPMLVNFIRKSSEEKLPGLGIRSSGLGPRTPGNGARSPATHGARSPPHGAQSRASEYSEGHESKKNVNFGLETKKSIIHPRSDSSNRSTRFSLSSEKSYGNGVSTYSQARPAIMNEDIEKRVLVNKDGSLSVEMRVRFRLQNDETLQWSTQIKKSPSLTNECCPLNQAQPHYLQQGQSESGSDPDSTSFDPEGVYYSGQTLQHVSEGNHCPCCYQRQEQQYDLWENPAHRHKQPPVPPPHTSSYTIMRNTHSSSSSSSCNSRRVVRCRARLSNCRGGSGLEQSQLVQEEMCVTEQVERRVEVEPNGDTHVEVCRMSSRSEVLAVDSNLRPLSQKSVEDELLMEDGEEHPLSTVSSSSHVLQSLKEDQDDDLPPSASQCCHRNEPSPTFETHPTSNISAGSEHNKQGEGEVRGSTAVGATSSCQCGAASPRSTAEAEERDGTPSSKPRMSKASCRSSRANIPASEEADVADEDKEIKRVASGLSGQTGLSEGSLQSRASSVCPNCGGCKRAVTSVSNSRASQSSRHSQRASPKPATPLSSQETANNGSDDNSDSNVSAVSTQSNKTNLTNHGCFTETANVPEGRASSAMSTSDPEVMAKEEERVPSATSVISHRSKRLQKSGEEKRSPSAVSAQSSKSHKSNCSSSAETSDIRTREEAEMALSSLLAKSGASSKTNTSVNLSITVASPTDNTTVEEDATNKRSTSALCGKSNVSDMPGNAERPDSVLSAKSAKSHVSVKSGTSRRSTCSHCARAVSPGARAANEPVVEAVGQEIESEKRAASATSNKSNLSNKSTKSHKSTRASNRSLSPRSETGGEKSEIVEEETQQRTESVMSAKLENEERAVSAGSSKSHKSNCNEKPGAGSERRDNSGDGEEAQQRATTALSGKSASSAKSHHSNCDAGSGEASVTPNGANGLSFGTKGDERQSQECMARAKSIESKSSLRSSTSHKSKSSNIQSVSPNANVVYDKTPEGVDEDGNDSRERALSSASAQSGKSNVSSALSHKSSRNRAADIAVVETANADEDNRPISKSSEPSYGQILSPRTTCVPQTHSPKAPATPISNPQSRVNQFLPGRIVGDTRGPSALSVHSIKSAKSGRSTCRCGAASAKKEKEDEDKEATSEEVSEQAASILSSSTKRTRRESGGSELLSRNSSGSVSLGLPEDTADSDSGKSSVSFHVNTERVKTGTPDVPKSTDEAVLKGDVEGTGSSKYNNNGSKSPLAHNPSAVDIPTIETPRGSDDKGEESGEQIKTRAKSSRSHKSSCSCSVKAAAQMLETGSLKSASRLKPSKTDTDNRASPATSSASAKIRSKSPASASIKNANVTTTTTGDSANNDTENQAVSRPASKAKSPSCVRPESAASAQSDSLNPVKCLKARSSGSVKTSSSQKTETLVKSSSPCPRPGSKVEKCSESTLSNSLSAADLLKETMAAARPHSRGSKASQTSDKPRSEKGRRSRNQTHPKELVLTPACLPNASPNEVVSDWLRSIPTDSSILALGDELHEEEQVEMEKAVEEDPGEEETKEEEIPEDERVDEDEKAEGKEEEVEDDAAEKKSSDPAPGDALGTSHPRTLLLSSEPLPKNWQSSATVMKVLLSSSLGRCQSLPEVSPFYGRRLSTSARGFLDCLAQLQLIEPAVHPGCDQKKNRQYEDIMAMLQSLWLTEPRDIEDKKAKDVGTEQVTPPRSSSGVDMSSGSAGSAKENGNKGGDETDQNQTNMAECFHEDEVAERVVEEEEEGNAKVGLKKTETEPGEAEQTTVPSSLDSPKATENPSSVEKSSANDSSKSPTDNEQETLEDSSSSTPPTVLRAPLSKKLSQDPDPVWILHLLKKLEKQFMNHYVNAMREFKVRWDLDDSVILDTMISELRDEVSQRIQSSIQREIKKIQGRAGRVGRSPLPPKGSNLSRESTMTERRRRMLRVMKNQSVKTADSLSDGEMTGEFSDQRSDDEYCPCDACVRKKMAARPLKTNPLAAEAPVMMEFDLLKILQLKKSPSPSAVPPPVKEEGDSMVVEEEGRNLAVVQEEEEEDETKEDIKADVILEETIPEEDEEIGKEEDGGEAGDEEEVEAGEENGEEEEEEEAQCQCNCAKNEESEEREEETAEGEEETSNNTAEDEIAGEEEEEEGEEETGSNEGEAGTAGEEEENDEETVKETTGEGQTTENTEDEEMEAAEVEDCEVSEFKPNEEEEQTTGRESEEEEASGETEDDNAAKNVASEESTLVEEFTEGNGSVSAEAEDEDDGDGEEESHEEAKGGESEEQEREASEEERASPQGQGVTEGEEADAEDSETDSKRLSDTSADESGRDGAPGDKEETEGGGEGEVNGKKREDGALLHQFTRTSVESQPGSLEDVDTGSPQNPVNSPEVPKTGGDISASGGACQRSSRSPARVKRRKPKECDVELDF